MDRRRINHRTGDDVGDEQAQAMTIIALRPIALAIPLFAGLLLATDANAQAPRDCGGLWKEADVDANGSLTREEDERGYFEAFRVSGRSTVEAGTISRDEFMLYCSGTVERASEPSKQATEQRPDNRGKGDLTPGLIPFPRSEAKKRIEALGYRDIGELALDEKGIWRSTATVNGKQVPIAVDVQGDVVAGG